MFIAARIANGIVAVLALLTGALLIVGGEFLTKTTIAQILLIFIFFLSDCVFRKKESVSDTVFTAIWTIFLMLELVVGMMKVFRGVPEELGGPLLMGLAISLIYGVPFLLNSIHLLRLLRQKKSPA